ncbi:methyltransferase domain-containing protein [Neoroseomonas soli]|uniref:Class I SAM-dependent methyltransferase n=1 Tax=Neoroseomonas soli TaxID=1081025 RepID=A0A9X9X2W5_9PROT|nr:class I SAM-dependent methyltransferase [Neoroseomonas soli]MBR0673744.1 class I SAM-dependent methyltransferase [Neoroseomonas soli]
MSVSNSQRRLGGSGGSSLPPDLPSAIAARYAGRITQGFVRGKLRADPVVPVLLANRNLGHVLDLGCGRGQLAIALLLAGVAERVSGLDLDAAKIAAGNAAARNLPARFATADLATAEIPACDTVLLIDVLLQMPPAVQDALLARILAAEPRRILIRAFDPQRGWRSAFGFAMERVRRLLGGDLGLAGAVAPRPLRQLAAPLEGAGYAVTLVPCWAGTPLPNVLLVAERS